MRVIGHLVVILILSLSAFTPLDAQSRCVETKRSVLILNFLQTSEEFLQASYAYLANDLATAIRGELSSSNRPEESECKYADLFTVLGSDAVDQADVQDLIGSDSLSEATKQLLEEAGAEFVVAGSFRVDFVEDESGNEEERLFASASAFAVEENQRILDFSAETGTRGTETRNFAARVGADISEGLTLRLIQGNYFEFDETPTIRWPSYPGANRYQLIFNDEPQGITSDTEHELQEPIGEGEHKFQIERYRNQELLSRSLEVSFSYRILESPAFDQESLAEPYDLQPTLRWDDVVGAEEYSVLLDGEVIYEGPDPEFSLLEALSPGQSYEFEVQATNPHQQAGSTTVTFEPQELTGGGFDPGQKWYFSSEYDSAVRFEWSHPVPNVSYSLFLNEELVYEGSDPIWETADYPSTSIYDIKLNVQRGSQVNEFNEKANIRKVLFRFGAFLGGNLSYQATTLPRFFGQVGLSFEFSPIPFFSVAALGSLERLDYGLTASSDSPLVLYDETAMGDTGRGLAEVNQDFNLASNVLWLEAQARAKLPLGFIIPYAILGVQFGIPLSTAYAIGGVLYDATPDTSPGLLVGINFGAGATINLWRFIDLFLDVTTSFGFTDLHTSDAIFLPGNALRFNVGITYFKL